MYSTVFSLFLDFLSTAGLDKMREMILHAAQLVSTTVYSLMIDLIQPLAIVNFARELATLTNYITSFEGHTGDY